MRKLALYPGCLLSTSQYGYEMSVRKLMPKFDIELVDVPGFSCCGGPVRHLSMNMTYYLAIRNLAIAKKEGLDILAPCNVCHLSLTEAKMKLFGSPDLLEKMKEKLMMEGLEWDGPVEVVHPLEIMHENLDVIKDNLVNPIGKKLACHYGCHILRYSDLERCDHTETPVKMEEILRAAGAESEPYPERINCCGGLYVANQRDSALTKAGQKVEAAQFRGYDGLVDTCPWGHRLMDGQQQECAQTIGEKLDLPVIYLTQVVGYAMGLDPKELGFDLNLSKPLFGGDESEEAADEKEEVAE